MDEQREIERVRFKAFQRIIAVLDKLESDDERRRVMQAVNIILAAKADEA